jgi:hypothetical protein
MTQDKLTRLRQLIREKPYLIWYTKGYDQLDVHAIAEAIYNFGDWEDLQLLHQTISIPEAAKIFDKLASAKRCNLHAMVKNYFTLYYDRYA